MSILSEIREIVDSLEIPVETGYYSKTPENEYCVLTPTVMTHFYSNNEPQIEIHEVRISLFSKKNYLERQQQLVQNLLAQEFTISEIRFIEYEEETKYYHVAIDIAKHYEMEEE